MPNKFKKELYNARFSTRVIGGAGVEAESIPVGNPSAVETLFKGMEAIEFVNEVLLGEEHPTDDWSGNIILTEEWARSYANAVNKTPGLLYTKGHEDAAQHWATRAIAGGYIVGGKVENGRLLLRNRLLVKKNEADKEFVEQTMREIAAGMLSTSTGDIQKRRIEFVEDGKYKQYAVESVKNQTNALVEHDMHASDAKIVSANFRLGYYDSNDRFVGVEPNATDGGGNHDKGEETMGFKETVEIIKTALKSGEGDMPTLLKELGLEVVTEEVKTAVARLKAAEDKVGDISAFVSGITAEREASFTTIKSAKLKEAFTDSIVHEVAESLFSVKAGGEKEITDEITRLKGLGVIKNIQTDLASRVGYVPSGDESAAGTKNTGVVEA